MHNIIGSSWSCNISRIDANYKEGDKEITVPFNLKNTGFFDINYKVEYDDSLYVINKPTGELLPGQSVDLSITVSIQSTRFQSINIINENPIYASCYTVFTFPVRAIDLECTIDDFIPEMAAECTGDRRKIVFTPKNSRVCLGGEHFMNPDTIQCGKK